MINAVISKIFGTANERAIKRLLPIVTQVNAFTAEIEALTDDQLRDKTAEFRVRFAETTQGIDAKASPKPLP